MRVWGYCNDRIRMRRAPLSRELAVSEYTVRHSDDDRALIPRMAGVGDFCPRDFGRKSRQIHDRGLWITKIPQQMNPSPRHLRQIRNILNI